MYLLDTNVVSELRRVRPYDAVVAWLRTIDAMIAATAEVHSLTVVTRNVKDFALFGIPVLNPFVAPR